MKISQLLLASTLLLLGVGCASATQTPVSNAPAPVIAPSTTAPTAAIVAPTTVAVSPVAYAPPSGADTASGVETPGRRRLMTATSKDGLAWTRTNAVITDQANVPDLLMAADGTLYLYFSGWTVGTKQNAMGVAVSKDQAKTWTFYGVEFSGSRTMEHSGDPDIVQLADGTFRMYSTSGLPGGGGTAIYYSEGTDGIHFDTKGIAFQADPPALDSNTYLVGSTWRMVTLSGQSMQSYDATSADGKTFVKASLTPYAIDGKPTVMSNVLSFDGGYRMYGFRRGDIRSFFSTDGISWKAETGIRLSLDEATGLESEYVKDPAVIQLNDGTYLMVYVTQIP